MKYFLIFSLIVLTLFLFDTTSHAVPITFAYDGIVNNTYGYPESLPFDAFLGDKLRIVYTFESTTPDNNPSANGDYMGAVMSIFINVGGNTYTANTGNIIITNNDVNPDQYLVDIPTGLTGPDVGGISVYDFDLNFSDDTHTVYTSDALPTVQPDPSAFSLGSYLWLSFQDFNFPENGYGIIMTSETVPAAPVPEPSTIFLLSIAIAGLAGTGIIRKKNSSPKQDLV